MVLNYKIDRQIEEINETKNRFLRLIYNIPLVFRKLSNYGMNFILIPFKMINKYGREIVNYTFCKKKKLD